MSKRISKVLALAVAVVLCFGLAACGGSSAPAPAKDSSAPAAAASSAPAAAAESSAPAADTKDASAETAAAPAEEPAADGEGWTPDPADYELIDAAHFDRTWNLNSDELGSFQFDFSTHDPENSLKTNFYKEWADMVNKATDGGIEITIYANGTLASPGEVVSAVEMGTADMGWVIGSNFADVLPISTMFYLPGIGMGYNSRDVEVIWDLYDKYPQMEQEFNDNNLKPIHMYTTGVTGFNGTKSMTKLDDLKGLNIRTLGGYAADAVSALGANPISMGPGDMYDALSKNVIDGYTIEFSGVNTFKLYEVTDYYNVDPIYTSIMFCIMNMDSYNSLPDEYKEVIDYFSGREMSEQMAYLWEVDNAKVEETMTEPSQIQHFDEAEFAGVQELLLNYSKGVAEKLTTPDFDGTAFLNDILAGVEQYKDFVYYRFNE